MIKKQSVIVFLFLICLLLCACQTNELDYNISSYDAESHVILDLSNDTTSDSSFSESTSSLVIKEKKYTFQKNDLIILNVTNETDANISVTIIGKYLDESGNELKIETQTFDQFSAGYSKYFLFNPELTFSKFTYSVETATSSGPFYAKDLSFSFKGLLEGKMSITEQEMKGDYKLYPTLVAEYEFQLKGSTELKPEGIFILFNDNDQIVAIEHLGGFLTPAEKNFKCTILYQTTEDELNRPAEFEGEFRAIYVLQEIAPIKR